MSSKLCKKNTARLDGSWILLQSNFLLKGIFISQRITNINLQSEVFLHNQLQLTKTHFRANIYHLASFA